MPSVFRVGVIGYGNMASAIVGGAHRNGIFQPSDTFVFDKSQASLEAAESLGINVCTSVDELIEKCNVILLAVKPQQLDSAVGALDCDLSDKCVISIIAGVSISKLERLLNGAEIIRVMPNTPIMLGCGATVISPAANVRDEYRDFALNVFGGSGVAEIIDESKMNSIIAINGSSPAYFFRLAELTCDYAEANAIDRDSALQLFAAAMEGSARMLRESGKSAEQLRIQVCSPGGTTLAALETMASGGFETAYLAGLDACTRRAGELGGE